MRISDELSAALSYAREEAMRLGSYSIGPDHLLLGLLRHAQNDAVRFLLDAGVDRIIVGTRAITDMEWFREMSHAYPHKLVMGLDTKDGKATVKGWQESSNTPVVNILDSIRDLPVAGVLNTNVDVEGQGKGINEEWVAKFAKMCPHKVIASGGVTTEEDAKILAKYDTMAAVVGVAVYTGLTEPWNWSTPWEA